MDTLTGIPSATRNEGSASPLGREYEETLREEDIDDDDDIATRDTLPETGQARGAKTGDSSNPPPPPTLRAWDAAEKKRSIAVDGKPRFARDLMTRHIQTIGPDDPLLMLEEHMEAFRFRHLPVVEGDVLVGLISHSDLLHASASRLSMSAPEENAILHQLPAWRIMREELVTVRPSDPLERV